MKRTPPKPSLTEHLLTVVHSDAYKRDFAKTRREVKTRFKEMIPGSWKSFFTGPGIPTIYCDGNRFPELMEIQNSFIGRWAIAAPIIPHRARCRCADVETAWGPAGVVERILARYLKGYWPSTDDEHLPRFQDGTCEVIRQAGDPFALDESRFPSVSIRKRAGTIALSWDSYFDDRHFRLLSHRVLEADHLARAIAGVAPKPGPGRKRDTARELTRDQKERAGEIVHALYQSVSGTGVDPGAPEKDGGFIPNLSVDGVKAAFGPARPLVFSVPVVKEGKVAATIPVHLLPEEVDVAPNLLRQAGLDSAFIKLYAHKARRARLETLSCGIRRRTREEMRDVWAAIWSDILLVLCWNRLSVSNVIASDIGLALWQRYGTPRPMTSRGMKGCTKEPTLGSLRRMFERFAEENAPDANTLLQIVEEEKARHAEDQTAAPRKIKTPRR